MKLHPTMGNLQVEEHDDHVVLRLRLDTDGAARFTYREINALAAFLAALSPAPDEDDWQDLI